MFSISRSQQTPLIRDCCRLLMAKSLTLYKGSHHKWLLFIKLGIKYRRWLDLKKITTDYFNSVHWGRVTHIWVIKLTTIGSDNGLSPGRRWVIIRTKAVILFIWPLETNFSEISSKIHTFSFKKLHLKIPLAKWRQFCLGLNLLIHKVDG